MTRSRFKDSRRPYFWCECAFLQLGCSPVEVALYCVLADSANQEDRCWPSYESLAARLSISRRTAIRGIKRLCELGAVRKSPQFNPQTGKTINIYELVDLPKSVAETGDTHVTGDIHDTPQVTPVSPHRCHQSTSNKEPLNKEGGNEERTPPSDLLWEHFSAGFQKQAGHPPRPSVKQRAAWKELTDSMPAALIRSKIDAWWEYTCPRLVGNRTLGAFLQWFDDIPVTQIQPSSPSLALSPEDWHAELIAGTAAGRSRYRELLTGVTDDDAKVRTLMQTGVAYGTEDARIIINACESHSQCA